jgi:RNA polymerase sigma factor (sigma-70 family)
MFLRRPTQTIDFAAWAIIIAPPLAMTHSQDTSWPSFSTAYVDAFGPIDGDIYATAGFLWPMASRYAESVLKDVMFGQVAMMKACARTTARRPQEQISNLRGYVLVAFRHEIQAERRRRERLVQFDEKDTEPTVQDRRFEEEIETKILIEQIISRMRPKHREIFEHRALGYSYEELAPKFGTTSAVLRSELSKEFKRIKKELADSEGDGESTEKSDNEGEES